MPHVSIIMPAFDSARYIAESIRSVQAQTFHDWELLVADDASRDETRDIVRSFSEADARIRLLCLETNQGAGAARQKALDAAKGRFIAFLDADDLWKPEKLFKQLLFMEQTGQPFSFTFYDLMDEAGKPLRKRVEAPQPLTYRQLFRCNFVGNLTGIYDTAVFGKATISHIRRRQDWMLWQTILKKLGAAFPVPESLASYRVREDSISASKVKMLRYNYAVYRKFHGFGRLHSLFCMVAFLYAQLVVKPRYIKAF